MMRILWGASAVLFGYLMCVRIGLLHFEPQSTPFAGVALPEKEYWLNIYQGDRKIGYTHRRLAHQDTGYSLSEATRVRFNTMGMVHTVDIRTRAALDTALGLAAIDFTLASHRFFFHAVGRVEKDVLHVSTAGREVQIPLDGPIYVTAAVLEAVDAAGLTAGDAVRLTVFDPATLGRRTIQVTPRGRESLNIMGNDIDALKLQVDIMGATLMAWVDDDGSVVQEKGLLGMILKQVSREDALDNQPLAASSDLTRLVSIAADRTIDHPERLFRLRVGMEGVPAALFLDGDRQQWRPNLLTIERERLPDPGIIDVSGMAAFLKPTVLVESDHPDIRDLARRIVSDAIRPLDKVRRLVTWVYDNIEKRPVISVPSARETLRHRQGDCNEHAVVLTALARAAGIPAQVEAGLVYMNGRFYYHAWNVVYLGRWVTADALMNQVPADVTHLRLVRGDPSQQVDLMGAIGRISLQIRDTQP